MTRQKVDKAQVLQMSGAGHKQREIAAHFGVSRVRISQLLNEDPAVRVRAAARVAAKAERMAADRVTVKARPVAPQAAAAPASAPPAAPHPIMATAWRYAALVEYAAARGITHAQALQLWHIERVKRQPVQKGQIA